MKEGARFFAFLRLKEGLGDNTIDLYMHGMILTQVRSARSYKECLKTRASSCSFRCALELGWGSVSAAGSQM
jgi:hypothetical protein